MDKDLRLRSLLFELHFEQQICPAIKARRSGTSFTCGWMLGEKNGRPVAFRESSREHNQCDRMFSKHLKATGWEVRYLHFDGLTLKDSERRSDWFQAGCDTATDCLRQLRAATENTITDEVLTYFRGLDPDTLLHAWSSRSIMNSLMKAEMVSGIRDLDAVFLAGDGRLSVIEFKRKYPMRWCFPLPENFGSAGLPDQVFRSPVQFTRGEKKRAVHFGLDIRSHVRSLQDLYSSEVGYWYLILESENTSPADFFTPDLQPTYADPFLIAEITPKSFRGISVTEGKHKSGDAPLRAQSGSFNDGRRYQLTVPKADFRPFPVFPAQQRVRP